MIGAFFAWWLAQLADLLPTRLRSSGTTPADALVITPVGPLDQVSAVAAALRRNGKEMPFGRFSVGSGGLGNLPPSQGLPVVLRLAEREVLQKTLILPTAAEPDLEQVLAFEMDRETPFKPEEIYWNHRIAKVDRAHQQLTVRLLLLPKARLAPVMAALASAGIVPSAAEIADSEEAHPELPLDEAGDRRKHRSRRLFRPAATACLLLALAAVAGPFIRQSLALAALDRDIRVGRATAVRAVALRREIARSSRGLDLVSGELNKAGRPVAVLAKVTRVLPDDTYLTEFELRHGKLSLSGRSSGAARLIGALAADGFRNPAFAAPVTRLEALHAEVFTIVADVGPQP